MDIITSAYILPGISIEMKENMIDDVHVFDNMQQGKGACGNSNTNKNKNVWFRIKSQDILPEKGGCAHNKNNNSATGVRPLPKQQEKRKLCISIMSDDIHVLEKNACGSYRKIKGQRITELNH